MCTYGRFGQNILPTIIPTALTIVAGTSPGQSVLKTPKIIQVIIPSTIDKNAPVGLAFFQYNPRDSGTNNDTRLNTDDSPTSS
jgi:hypothetical protein